MNAIFGKARVAGVEHMPGRRKAAASPNRRALLAKVHLARKELGLSEDDYRAILFDVAGKRSAADCDERALIAIVERFKARGWKQAQPKGRGAGSPADHRSALKARALWISLHHLGAVANPSEQALEAFARRQLGCAKMQWMNQRAAFRLIEALKAMAERHGWDQRTEGVRPEAVPVVLRRRLVTRIAERLVEIEMIPAHWTIEQAAWRLAGIEMPGGLLIATTGELDRLAQALGDKLRAAPIQGGTE